MYARTQCFRYRHAGFHHYCCGCSKRHSFDLRIIGRPKVPLDTERPRITKRAWLALALVLVSLGLSAGAFYYFFRPRIMEKIVEKPIERIVEKEKLVPSECPKLSSREPSKSGQKKQSPPAASGQSPITLDCGGGNCAQTSGQTGGLTVGQLNVGSVARNLSKADRDQLTGSLAGFHSKVEIHALAASADAYQYAEQIRQALKAASVNVTPNVYLGVIPGSIVYGVRADFHGESRPQGGQMLIEKDSQVGILLLALRAGHVVSGGVFTDPAIHEDTIKLIVGFNPADQPK